MGWGTWGGEMGTWGGDMRTWGEDMEGAIIYCIPSMQPSSH